MNDPLTPYGRCLLCPRACAVDRRAGQLGFCGEGHRLRLSWAGLHRGEEPPVSGEGGAGTFFFPGCTLRCPFCQNDQISHESLGSEISEGELAVLMLRLQERGAESINLVTAGHFAPGVVAALRQARQAGLALPAVWNSSGFESAEGLELLREVVDIYLPDCKTLDGELARRLLGAASYPEAARASILAMVRTRPLRYEGERLRQGVIVRHLVLPGRLGSTRQVLEWFARELHERALLSLMFQYTPNPRKERTREPDPRGAAPSRRIRRRECDTVLGWLSELGIEEGFVQDPSPGDVPAPPGGTGWLPDFCRANPFPQGQAETLWHFRDPLG
jgi:putative pyruvate formate lyase activating enzyme